MTATTQATPAHRSAVLALMCAGMFLVLLDVTIVNVALPGIARGLHADVPALQWVVDGYAVAIASLLLAGGTLGDRFGHRRVLLVGMAAFGVASVGCAVAPVTGALVGARIVQGAGGALMLPSTMAVIADVFPGRAEQARALGTWAAASSLALPVGPLLGGALVSAVSWRLVFWINVPIVVAVVLASLRVVPDLPGRGSRRLDLPGLIGFAVGLGGLVFTVIEAGRGAGPGVLAASSAVTVVALALAVVAERRTAHPALPLDLLRRRPFLAPNLVALTMNFVVNGTLFVGTLYLQDVRGRSPLVAGLLVLPMAVPLVALAPVSGRLTARRGPRLAVGLGCLIAVPGPLLLLGVGPSAGTGWLEAAFAVLGCGAGLVTASVVAAVVRATPAERSGLATGVSNTARQIGTAGGVAVFGAVAASPSAPSGFVSGVHGLAVVAAALWALAFLINVGSAETARRESVPAAAG